MGGVPNRLKKALTGDDVGKRRDAVVRLRAYASAGPRRRRETRELLLAALHDPDEEVRRLAALGLESGFPSERDAGERTPGSPPAP